MPALGALETPRLHLEPPLERHAAALFAGLRDPALYAFLRLDVRLLRTDVERGFIDFAGVGSFPPGR